ncbi:MAG: SDR family oxidoreductase [Bacillota bacterium]|nr:SDR family oxidoreductase [Bacillota bacterium]
MDLNLKGKFAVITGGSKGIGVAVAEGLAKEGVDLCLIARDEARLKQSVDKLKSAYDVQVIGVSADVTRMEDIEHTVEVIKQHTSGVDILINNAGAGTNETIMDAPDEKWDHYWNLHVMAAVRFSRLLVPLMRERQGGVILNTASICAKQPLYYEPIYNTTKAALVMFSKCLANEVIKDNIRVNTINPGLILTEDWVSTAKKLTAGTDQTYQDYLDAIAEESTPMKRFATPEELADFYVFMCSDRASYCVGSTYFVDGGWLRTV